MGVTDARVAVPTPVSKLRPPRVRHAEITRAALLADERLSQAEVLAICAPAGYGKSTLAIQWASRCERPIAWLTVDESDNDPVTLINTVVTALAHAVPELTPMTMPAADKESFSQQVLPRFVSSVADLAVPVTVVIDDLHLIDSSDVRKVLKALVEALPAGSQVVFVGRSLTVVPLPLWRGQGRAVELHAHELAFRPSETAAAVRSFHGEVGTDDIHVASQGWPVAVFLLSQSRSSQSLTNVAEFIETEVLAPMPEDLREFVVDTAALGSVNVELAAAVTESPDAAHFLAEAITTVLISRTEQGWYNYHPLMQECVRDLLVRDDPQRWSAVNSAAARWYLDEAYMDTAVRFAIASGDGPTMGPVVWEASKRALLHGRTQTVLGWLDRIGPRALDDSPELSMSAAWANVANGDYGHVLRHAEQTVRLMPSDWLAHPGDFSIGPHLSLLIALTHYGLAGPHEALALAQVTRALVDPSDPITALAALTLGWDLALVGDPGTEAALQEAVALAQASDIASSRVETLAMLGLWLIPQGREAAGCERIDEALRIHELHDLKRMSSTSGIVALATVALAAFRGSADDVRHAVAAHAEASAGVAQIMAWYRQLAGGILAFGSVRIGDHNAYHEYISWSCGGGLCAQWAELAQQEYAAATPLSLLTPAELRVWGLLKGRMTLNEIAGTLFVSRETVKTHTGSIYRKLGVSSRREAQELAESWR